MGNEPKLTFLGNNQEPILVVTAEGLLEFNTELKEKLSTDEYALQIVEALAKYPVFKGMDISQLVSTNQALERQLRLQEEALDGLRMKVELLQSKQG